jgi:hypothetical protein
MFKPGKVFEGLNEWSSSDDDLGTAAAPTAAAVVPAPAVGPVVALVDQPIEAPIFMSADHQL